MNFDLESLPASVAGRLQNLLTDSDFFEIPLVKDLRTGPDEYRYEITVVAGNSLHTIHISDSSMPPALRPLVEELTVLVQTAT